MTQKTSSKRLKLTSEELEQRNKILDSLSESGEFDRYVGKESGCMTISYLLRD